MITRFRRKAFTAVIAVASVTAVLWWMPGPVEGCYTIRGVTTSGAYFLYLKDGNALWMFEHATRPILRGTYTKETDKWILTNSKTGRRIVVIPRLLYLRYIDTITGESGIEWRYPRIIKARKIIRQHFQNDCSLAQ